MYSISELANYSGIKAHTIRVWESRYGIIQPRRTATNIRYYQDADLKRLLHIALLKKNGFKISKIAGMSEAEMARQVAAVRTASPESTPVEALTEAMVQLDECAFDGLLRTSIERRGFERCMLEVVYPFLDQLSVLWLTGSIYPAQENFISYLIRQRLIVATDQLPRPDTTSAPRIVLYLPEGEFQELSLLFTHYLARARGWRCLYLGTDVSTSDLADVYRLYQPRYFFTLLSENFVRQPVDQYATELLTTFPRAELLLSGYQSASPRLGSNPRLTLLPSLQRTIDFLERAR